MAYRFWIPEWWRQTGKQDGTGSYRPFTRKKRKFPGEGRDSWERQLGTVLFWEGGQGWGEFSEQPFKISHSLNSLGFRLCSCRRTEKLNQHNILWEREKKKNLLLSPSRVARAGERTLQICDRTWGHNQVTWRRTVSRIETFHVFWDTDLSHLEETTSSRFLHRSAPWAVPLRAN